MLRCIAWLSVLSALIPTGCVSKACTDMGCGLPYEVNFTGASGKPGRYQIDVVADGVASTCEVTLPWTCDTQVMCSSTELPWGMTLSGCALGADREYIAGIIFHTKGPLTVDLVVRRDGMVVGQGSALPQYREFSPNGPECGPTCRSAPSSEVAIAP